MKEIKVTELALTTLMESMDKAASVIDLVRCQLEERHEGRPGVQASQILKQGLNSKNSP